MLTTLSTSKHAQVVGADRQSDRQAGSLTLIPQATDIHACMPQTHKRQSVLAHAPDTSDYNRSNPSRKSPEQAVPRQAVGGQASTTLVRLPSEALVALAPSSHSRAALHGNKRSAVPACRTLIGIQHSKKLLQGSIF